MERSDKNASEKASSSEKLGVMTKEMREQDTRNRLEREYNGKLIKYKELSKEVPEFAKWLKEVAAYGNVDAQLLSFRREMDKIMRDLQIE